MKPSIWSWFVVGSFVIAGASRAADIGTAFTYQGFLEKPAGTPVSGNCDFRFGLWDAEANGNPMGNSPQGPMPIQVTTGVFTANLDFGDGAFDGTARWLEIEVGCSGAPACAGGPQNGFPCITEADCDGFPCTSDDFSLLSPRVELTPAPHALALPGLRIDRTPGSPNVLGGFADNSAPQGVEGATIAGGGAAFVSNDGRCELEPTILCAMGENCPLSPVCIPDSSVGRCDDDAMLCDETQPCATGVCILPPAPNQALANYVSIGGGTGNVAGGGLSPSGVATGSKGFYSVVGGGLSNAASAPYSTVDGGQYNIASGERSTVGGGGYNKAAGNLATVAGGGGNSVYMGNKANGYTSTVGGGYTNTASASSSTVGGGYQNTASGNYSTVPGGFANVAGGDYSFAAGRRARSVTAGTFVWADSTDADFTSTVPNQFLIRASGGVGIGTPIPEQALDVRGVILAQPGPSGTHDNLMMKKTGPVGPSNVRFSLSHRSNATETWMYGYNGTTFRNLQGWDYAGNSVKFPADTGTTLSLDMTNSRVGIGTSAPASKLEIQGTTGGAIRFNPDGIMIGSNNDGFELNVVGGHPDGLNMGGQIRLGGSGRGDGDLNVIQFKQNGSEVMRVQNGGNVGIGVPSPSLKVDVGGRVRVRQGSDASAGIYFYQSTTASDRAFLGMANDDTVGFYGATGAAWSLNMNTTTGKVGIGTTSPDRQLEIEAGQGVVRINSLASNNGSVLELKNAIDLGLPCGGPCPPRIFGAINFLDINDDVPGQVAYLPGGMTFRTGGAERLRIDTSGKVGIGRTPTALMLEVEGDASKSTAGQWSANSDRRIKADIGEIENALDTLDRVRPVKFKYTEAYRRQHPSIRDSQYYNYVAQEFAEVFPDFVHDSGEDGILQLDAYPVSVVAVAAIQELHHIVQEKDCEIEALGSEISNLQSEISELKALVNKLACQNPGGHR